VRFYLDKILKLNGAYYEWNEKMTEITGVSGNSYGVIAQEVQKEFPEMVKMQENGYLSVDYIQLIPVMIESIKELNQEIENLKEIINYLKK
jgi:hypothetical protein